MTPERWHQATEIFHAARQRSTAEREAFVADACRGDQGLRHEVDALLAGHDEAGSFGDRPLADPHSPLDPGAMFGAYRIVGLAGRGGMGEVYRAHDAVLRRDVAIKILPVAFMADAGWMDRFDREARALAALNHPNIATIYGLEQDDGMRGLVLEYIEGPTLANRITGKGMPLGDVLRIASQLATALEAAHERGIVHRDIKPSNIKVTPSGVVKVLDFGLAKAVSIEGGARDAGMALTIAATLEGNIVGTAAYMSPEQARGQPIDRRTDIWAFGCVVFEMLAGRQAFAGETRSDAIAAILERAPDWSRLPASTPDSLRTLLQRCLEKDPGRRLRDIGDARHDLERAAAPPPAAPGSRHWPHAARVGALTAVVAGVAALAGGARWYPRGSAPSETPSMTFSIAEDNGVPYGGPELSPDGRRVAFIKQSGGVRTLWVRSFDALQPHQVPGSEGVSRTVWSPDGGSLGFFIDEGMRIAEAFGTGPVRSLPAVRGGSYGAMWCPDGRIVLGSLERTGLIAQSVADGVLPTQVTTLDVAHGEGGQLYPTLLPDGRHFLYLSEPSSTIWLASLDSKETRQILSADSQAVYAAPGYLLFLRGQTLYAQRFDATRLTIAGEPIALAVGVLTERSYGADFSVSSTGMLAYRTGTIHVPTQLTWIDRAGKRLGTLGPPGRYANIELSRDGTRVVMEALDPRTYTKDIWTIDVARGVLTQLTFDPGNETFPIWSPDGQWIMFASDRHGGWQLYRRRADGGGGDERVATTTEAMVPQSWAPDGQSMVYLQRPVKLGVLQLNGSRDRRLIDAAGPQVRQYLDGYGEISPDGRWLLYGSNESGPWEVYLRRFPESEGGKWKVSDRGAVSPRWRPDGREIFYYSGGDARIVAVPVNTSGATAQIGAPTPLFKANLLGGALPAILWRMNYAVSSDGQRFLLDEPLEDAYAKAPTVIMTNWMAALK